ncbi:cobalamin biosynthesis protein CobD [Tissierella creatinini]|nr:cobalamin biosynthesis protein CobD [Tissierella creatinini]TJX65603.1 cobalamin biosynthesis protein CobD [Soehngenia saccharolytica]
MINILLAVALDFLIGDPYSFPHPVKLMGKIISLEENMARKIFKSDKGLKLAGLIIVIVNLFLGFSIPLLLLKLVANNKIVYIIMNVYFIYTCIAGRCLHHEAIMVSKAMDKSLDEGRKRLSYIVGRDTSQLSEESIIKATIETVAENTSDGVIGPLFYIVVFGPPGGLVYKFINTMDSMLGYMNERYMYLGYFPAKFDDLFNLIPARITGLLMNIGSLARFDVKNGLRIMKRDNKNHKSPNSGYPESAVAGLLGIQLGGGNYYKGQYVDKPYIGDKVNILNKNHIKNTIEIMYRTEMVFLIFHGFILMLIR